MPTCDRCQHHVASGARFCVRCGAPIVDASASRTDPFIGQLFRGTYFVQQRLDDAGSGRIYKATHIVHENELALKIFERSQFPDGESVRRFQRQIQAVARLRHPGVAAVTDFGQVEDGTVFLAMELVSGSNLARVIAEEAPLPAQRTVRIATQVLSALEEAHASGVVHPDLAPGNVMVGDGGGERGLVKLIGFGIATATTDYMSPEQRSGEEVDARSNVYSVGVMVHEMATGVLPVEAATSLAVGQGASTATRSGPWRPRGVMDPGLEAVVMRALSTDGARRFGSVGEMREALMACDRGAVTPMASGVSDGKTVVMPVARRPGMSTRPSSHAPDRPVRETPPTLLRLPVAMAPPSAVPRAVASPTPPRHEMDEPEEVAEEAVPPAPAARRRTTMVLASVGVGLLALIAAGYFLASGRTPPRAASAPAPKVVAPPPEPPVAVHEEPPTPAVARTDAQEPGSDPAPATTEAPPPPPPRKLPVVERKKAASQASGRVATAAPMEAAAEPPPRRPPPGLIDWKPELKAYPRPPGPGTAVISVEVAPAGQVYLEGRPYGAREPVEFLVKPGTYQLRVTTPHIDVTEEIRAVEKTSMICITRPGFGLSCRRYPAR